MELLVKGMGKITAIRWGCLSLRGQWGEHGRRSQKNCLSTWGRAVAAVQFGPVTCGYRLGSW